METFVCSEAYQVACLNVTHEDWQTLTNVSLSKANLKIARKCLIRTRDWMYLNLIQTHEQVLNSADDQKNVQLFLAKLYSYRGLFSESAKIYKKLGAEHLAAEMFEDLQMYDQAKEYKIDGDPIGTAKHEMNDNVNASNKWSNTNLKDIRTMSKLYMSNGEYSKAFQLIEKTDTDRYIS